MSITYPDLTNDFPDVASDERYLFRDMTIDDLPFVVQYEKLLNALKTAVDGATDVSTYQEEWNALVAFRETDEYKNHVAPLNMTADKFQTIEDKTISSQRFAKRQKQQWIISESQPEPNEQAVDDVWFRVDEITESGLVNATPFYKGEDGNYYEFTVSAKISFSSNEDIDNIVSGNDVSNPTAVVNNESLNRYVDAHNEEFNDYKDSVTAKLDAIKADVSKNANNITKNASGIAKNTSGIATNKSNIAANTSSINTNKNSISSMQSTINTMNTNIKSLQTALQGNAKSLSGVYRTGVISGQERQTHVVSFPSVFNKIPTILMSCPGADLYLGTVTKGGFSFDIKCGEPAGEYWSYADVTWNATADTV